MVQFRSQTVLELNQVSLTKGNNDRGSGHRDTELIRFINFYKAVKPYKGL
jgi:hypothetical protein